MINEKNLNWEFNNPEDSKILVIDYLQKIDFTSYLKEEENNDLSFLDIESAITELEQNIMEIEGEPQYLINSLEEAKGFTSPLIAIGFYIAKYKFTMLTMGDLMPYIEKGLQESEIEKKVSVILDEVIRDLHLGFSDFEMLRVYKYELNNLKRIRDLNKDKLSSFSHTANAIQPKLKWLGTPSQFGFFIDLLIQGNYLEKPTGSFTKDANFYLQYFDIDTTLKTLAKELSEKTNSLSTENRNKVKVPTKDKLN